MNFAHELGLTRQTSGWPFMLPSHLFPLVRFLANQLELWKDESKFETREPASLLQAMPFWPPGFAGWLRKISTFTRPLNTLTSHQLSLRTAKLGTSKYQVVEGQQIFTAYSQHQLLSASIMITILHGGSLGTPKSD